MPIRPVLELSVAHPYLAAGALPGAALMPDAATAARLRGLRLVAKSVGAALRLYGDFGDAGPAIAPTGAVALGFGLGRLDPALAAATDTAALGTAPVFTDAGAPGGDPQRLRLAQAERRADPALLATVAVSLSPGDFAAAATGAPRRCEAALAAAAAPWCYHIVTNLPHPLPDWRIVRGTGAAGPAPAFGDAGRSEIDASAAGDDPAGAALLAAAPGLRVLRFVSDAPFPASETPVRALELHAGAARLFAALPNPSPAAAVRVGGAVMFSRVLDIVTS